MKKALISPLEPRGDGYRVAQISEDIFEVAEPFYWLDCSDDVVADVYYYKPETDEYLLTPLPPPENEIEGAVLRVEKPILSS